MSERDHAALSGERVIDWRETGHEFVGYERCERCGVLESRAIHSRNMHNKLRLPFVAAVSDETGAPTDG